jgi:hypothetical protein
MHEQLIIELIELQDALGRPPEFDDVCNVPEQAVEVIKQLEAQNTKFRAALETLAKLGNEPHYGNSDGNCIAQEALK